MACSSQSSQATRAFAPCSLKMHRVCIALALVVRSVALAYMPSGGHFHLAARITEIVATSHPEIATGRRSALRSVFASLGAGTLGFSGIIGTPQRASAVKDCFLDCKSNCLRNAPKSGDYCVQR